MKIIKKLSAMIEDELEGAEEYIKCALHEKEEDPQMADIFYALAKEEMGHMNKLHDIVVRKIREYRETDGEPPAPMQAVYDILHEMHMEKAAKIQWYLTKYMEK